MDPLGTLWVGTNVLGHVSMQDRRRERNDSCSQGYVELLSSSRVTWYRYASKNAADMQLTLRTNVITPQTSQTARSEQNSRTIGFKKRGTTTLREHMIHPFVSRIRIQYRFELISDNGAYGFMNGAQTDLFAAVGGANTGSPAASSSAAPSVVSSQTVASSMSTVAPSASSAAPASSNVAQSIAQVIVTSRWVTGVPTGAVANATPLPSNSTAQAAASISNVSQAQAVAASSSARAAGVSISPSNSPAQAAASSSTVSQAQAGVASSPAQAAGVSTSPLVGVVQAGATASTSTLASLPTKGATSASSGGKVCKRRKRWQKRSTTLPVGNYVESHHSARSAKRATPHVIAQRRWEADRARRGLGKESQGKGVY